jgi:hypothetical protein
MAPKPTPLASRLKEVMDRCTWTAADVQQHSGASRSLVAQWLGKAARPVQTIGNVKAAVQLQEASGFSAVWLAIGEGPKMAAERQPHHVAERGGTYAARAIDLNTAQRDVLEAYDRLPASRQRAVREELMREAAQFMSDVQDFQRRAGVKGVVSPQRAAETLPPRPDGEQPETVPGKLE